MTRRASIRRPARRLFDKVLEELEIRRKLCYVSNTVQHFKYEWRGKTRLHKTPRQIEVNACLPWLHAEIAEIRPDLIVYLAQGCAVCVRRNLPIDQKKKRSFAVWSYLWNFC